VGNLINVLTPVDRPWTDRFADPTLPCLVDEEDVPDEEMDEATDASDAPEARLDEASGAPVMPPEELADPLPEAPSIAVETPQAALPEAESEQSEDESEALADLLPVESLTHVVPKATGPLKVPTPAVVDEGVLGLPIFSRPFALFQDLILAPGTPTAALARGMAAELGDFADGVWRVERAEVDGFDVELLLVREGTVHRPPGNPGMVQITKRIRFGGKDATVKVGWTVVNRSREPVRTRLAIVIPLNVDGGVGVSRTLHLPKSLPLPQDQPGSAEDVADFALRFADLGLLIRARPEHPVRVDHFPLIAPVRRREGHVPVHQGTVAVLSWPLELWGEETCETSMVLEIHSR
jgi:hypothetical protein